MVTYQFEKIKPMNRKRALTLAGMLGVTLSLSLCGAVWVDDEFTAERGMIYAMAVPVTLWVIGLLARRSDLIDRARRRQALLAVLVFCFGAHLWGILLLANAVPTSEQKKEVVGHAFKAKLQDRNMVVSMRRGNLGWLYRSRF